MVASSLVDLVKVQVLTTGTGALLLGPAVPSYRGIEALINGATYSYSIQQNDAYEIGKALYLASSTQLIRSVERSSNGDDPLDLKPSATVAFVALSEDILARDVLQPLYGFGAPLTGQGLIGQVYYDLNQPVTLYGPKTDAGWGSGVVLQGAPGPAMATFSTLALFEAAPITNATQVLQDPSIPFGRFDWETTNAPYTADNDNIIKADSTSLSVGAWVRQKAASIQTSSGLSVQEQLDQIAGIEGREYLSTFHKGLFNGTAQIIVTSGDSTTEGDFAEGFTPAYLINHYLRSCGFSAALSVLNAGHSGSSASQWVSTYLATDLASDPTLYTIRWGLNGLSNQSAALNAQEQLGYIEQGLQFIRNTQGLSWLDLPIVLMPPNSVYDDEAFRTAEYLDLMSSGCRQLAREYHCAFFDTRHYMVDAHLPDSSPSDDPLRGWIHEDYTPGSDLYVHPTKTGNFTLIGGLCELLLSPGMVWNRQNLFWNEAYTGSSLALASDTLTSFTFPGGLSYMACLTADGFPYQGVVETHKHASMYGWQDNYFAGPNNTKRARRFFDANTNGWSPWRYEVTGLAEQVDFDINVNVGAGWTAGTGAFIPGSALIAGQVRVVGAVAYSSGGFADNTIIAVLPSNIRPTGLRFVPALHQQGGAYTGRCGLVIAADGTVKILGATGLVAGDLVFLDSITVS